MYPNNHLCSTICDESNLTLDLCNNNFNVNSTALPSFLHELYTTHYRFSVEKTGILLKICIMLVLGIRDYGVEPIKDAENLVFGTFKGKYFSHKIWKG